MRRAFQMLALVVVSTAMLNGAAAQQQTAPDNTKRNKTEATTAEQQKNNKSDLETTRRIRKAIVDDKALSTYAQNIKIVTEDGQVTLTGPVNTSEEQAAVAAKALQVAGAGKVINQTEVAPSKTSAK
jgi:hyperosmotically inducible protein